MKSYHIIPENEDAQHKTLEYCSYNPEIKEGLHIHFCFKPQRTKWLSVVQTHRVAPCQSA